MTRTIRAGSRISLQHRNGRLESCKLHGDLKLSDEGSVQRKRVTRFADTANLRGYVAIIAFNADIK